MKTANEKMAREMSKKFIDSYYDEFGIESIDENGNVNLTELGLICFLERFASQFQGKDKAVIEKQKEFTDEEKEAMLFIIDNPSEDVFIKKNSNTNGNLNYLTDAGLYWSSKKMIADKGANKLRNKAESELSSLQSGEVKEEKETTLRDELKAFQKYHNGNNFGDIEDWNIDEYLKTR